MQNTEQKICFDPFVEDDLSPQAWRTIFGSWRVVDGALVHQLPERAGGNSDVILTANSPDVESFDRWAVIKFPLPKGGYGKVRLLLEARLTLHDGVTVSLDDDAIEWSPYFGMNPVISDIASGSRGHECHPFPWPNDGAWHRIEIEGDASTIVYRFDGRELFRLARPEQRAYRQITLESFSGVCVRKLEIEGDEPAVRLTRRQDSPFAIAALVDFADDMHFAAYTLERLDAMMAKLRELGVTRIYWMHTLRLRPEAWGPDADPRGKARIADWNHRYLNRPDGELTGPVTIEACYPFLKNAVEISHRHGMECFGVMKPFDIPSSSQVGENSPFALEYFHKTHPEAMLQRCPSTSPGKGAVRTLRFYKDNANRHALQPEQLVLWVSDDNQTFERVTAPYRVSFALMTRQLTDHWSGHTREVEVETITLEDLNLEARYFVLVVEGERAFSFANRVGQLAEALDAEGRRVAIKRNLPEAPKVSRTDWNGDGGFIFDGFSMPRQETGNWRGKDWIELYQHLDGADLGIAFERGEDAILAGAPSPLHPASQAFWLEWIDEMLAAGVDGVDLRIMNHINRLDWANYGFGSLASEAFRAKYGEELEPNERCRERHAALMGEAYTQFLREASRRVRQAGGKMQHHVSRPMEQRPGQRSLIHMEWNWRGWLEEGLLDVITLKDHELGGAFYEEVSQEAARHGVATFHCPYLGCLLDSSPDWPAQMSSLLDWEREVGAGGIILYEVATFLRGDEGNGVRVIYPEIPGILSRAQCDPQLKENANAR
jgi:hypothetical protein